MTALLTACAQQGGTTNETVSATVVSTTSTAIKPSSGRPRDVELDDRLACELLSADQFPMLEIDSEGHTTEIEALKATGCTWTVTGASNILAPVLHEDIGAWMDGKRIGKGEWVAPVAGFPTITVAIPGSPDRCDLMVGTTDNQYLAVAFSVSPGFLDRFPTPCDGARQLAEAAMQNLIG
ncbi:hypothetical protein ALI22I_01760 [Saccharothrix sp. ALI-22-I]|nr:hypothetical protein ALI22I_07785 [Saccharothrix sp. ALI-22-I]ONI92780.1 hypothetical protein ALI22I_01760 [Saccharothrix sp. ALI-22-I]